MKFTYLFLIVPIVLLFGCKPKENCTITKSEMYNIVKEAEKMFSIGIQKKDSAMLVNIYSDSAQYVQPGREILIGKSEIGKDWADFLRKKENPIDIILEINDIRGNREIIYETGKGYTLLADSSRWNFNYVNVWRLQTDGSYKLEIDTYNY